MRLCDEGTSAFLNHINTLVEWGQYLRLIGHAVNKKTIGPKVESILEGDKKGRPSWSWIHYFIKRHPELKLAWGVGLDPIRAHAFNFEAVNHYFTLLRALIDKDEFLWENVYNMDEKGIQLGGGRKGDPTRYLFSKGDKAKYRLKSNDLQLVTVSKLYVQMEQVISCHALSFQGLQCIRSGSAKTVSCES